MSEHFDLDKHLRPDSPFRTRLRTVDGLTPHEMDSFGDALGRALEKHAETHRGEDRLTAQNFERVMGHLREDPHFKHQASIYAKKAEAFESAVRSSLKLPPEEAA
ncbi:MAG TPA: hypothetical protein VMT80_02495 [Candidatus Paceibacterota bacterium]|nr:hypothetical protein [Candidatus Paceibacterota bacterium]